MIFSFDPDDPTVYTLAGGASFYTDDFTSPPNSLLLSGASAQQSCTWTVDVLSGVESSVYLFAQAVFGSVGSGLYLELDDGINFWSFHLDSDLDPGHFGIWSVGIFTPQSASLTFRLRVLQAFIGDPPVWLVDDVIFTQGEEMGKWAAISEAITVLKGINGTSSLTDLGSRVYLRNFTPVDHDDTQRPYACMPLADEDEALDYPGNSAHSGFSLTIYAYFDENKESDPLNTTAAEEAANFRDDLLSAYMADPSLSGTVQNAEIRRINSKTGGEVYAMVEATLVFDQWFSRADLS